MVRKRNKREDSFDRAEKAAEAAAVQELQRAKAGGAGDPRQQPPEAVDGEDAASSAVVSKEHNGVRVDKFLAAVLSSQATRSRLQRALRDGGVLLNGVPVTQASQKLRAGDRVEWLRDAQRPPPGLVEPEDVPLHVYHEDDCCIVLEKPAGMCTHPAGGLRSGTLVNALLYHVGYRSAQTSAFKALSDGEGGSDDEGEAGAGSHTEARAEGADAGGAEGEPGAGSHAEAHAEGADAGGAEAPRSTGLSNMSSLEQQGSADAAGDAIVRPGIVHRLDRGTSGVMVVAKTDAAHASLATQFATKTSKRSYLALVWGVPEPKEGTITGPIGRDPGDRLRMTVVAKGKGKPAVTHYSLEEVLDGGHVSLLRFRLETGRTHQVRVHARHLGHPLLGDQTYGGAQLLRGPRTPEHLALYEQILPGVGGSCEGLLARPALHAASLGFAHPAESGRALHFTSSLPKDMEAAVQLLRSGAAAGDAAAVAEDDELRVTVSKLNGEEVVLSARKGLSVAALKLEVEAQTGLDADRQVLVLAGGTDAPLRDEALLVEYTASSHDASELRLQLVMSATFTYDLDLLQTSGPNSPRFGFRSTYTWQMTCGCGHSDRWVDVDGYDFYSLQKLSSTRTCPSCGGAYKKKLKRAVQ